MSIVIRIGLGRSKSGKILDRNTTWHNILDYDSWAKCVNDWADKKYSGKPLFISRSGRAYKPITGEKLLALRKEFI